MIKEHSFPTGLPNWLTLGLKSLELRLEADANAWEKAVQNSGVENRTLVNYTRIANFLLEHYPEALDLGSDFVAGSAVMLELMKLQELSADIAKIEASSTFSGYRSVRELRSRVQMYRQEMAAMRVAPAQTSQQRSASFIKEAVAKVSANPSNLKLDDLIKFEMSDVRTPLVPKLIAHCESRQVAIDIRSPDIKAGKSPTEIAVIYCTRIGALMLRYDEVIMLMPESNGLYASAIFKLLKEWSKEPLELLKKVDIVLVGSEQMTYVKKPT